MKKITFKYILYKLLKIRSIVTLTLLGATIYASFNYLDNPASAVLISMTSSAISSLFIKRETPDTPEKTTPEET